jgi:hypothetical protein
MKKYITLLAAGLILFPANLAYAEEVVEEVAQEPETSYAPPPEASDGVGGWSVVVKETGRVVGGHVCTIEVCGPEGEWGGVLPKEFWSDYGCGSEGCVYRFQSVAEEGGNVAGYLSDESNDVHWNENESNFTVKDGLGRTSTLIPERTDGRGAQSGLVDIVQKTETNAGVKIEQRQKDFYDEDAEIDILFPEWGERGNLFSYLSQLEAEKDLQTDIDNDLLSEGYTTDRITTESAIDEETGEEITTETTEIVVDEENAFVKTVRIWTESVINFFRGILS